MPSSNRDLCTCIFLLCALQKQVVLEAREGLAEKTVTRSEPIHVTNAQLVCPETGKPTAVKRQFLEDGTKVRVAKVSGAIIPKPEILKQRRRLKSTALGPKDTDQTDAHSITFKGLDALGNEIQ
jgi:Ribosomal proteins 50S L24/mitochondrial 39S L24